jgi:hypothetical protein
VEKAYPTSLFFNVGFMNLRHMKSIVIFLLLVTAGYSQPFKYKNSDKIEGLYAVFNGAEFLVNKDGYTVLNNSAETAKVVITGKKIFIESPGGEYFAVANFAFDSDKNEYPVRIDVFNSSLESRTYVFQAPHGLPHPSVNLTDNGELILFDPMTYRVEVHSSEGIKEYSLEKSVEFEMERAFYTAVDDENFYLLIMESSLNPGEDADNVFLYVAGFDFIIKEKRIINVDVPVAMFLDKGKLLVSGVDFQPAGTDYRSYVISSERTELLPYAFEKIERYNNGYAAKYGSRLFLLDENYKVTGSRDFNARITDIAVFDAGVAVLVKEDEWNVYTIGEKMDIDKNVSLDYLNGGNAPVFGFAEDTLVLQAQDNTIVLNEFIRNTK